MAKIDNLDKFLETQTLPLHIFHQFLFKSNSFFFAMFIYLFTHSFICLFVFGCVTCKILVPRSGSKPRPLAVKGQSPNH